MKRLSLDLSVIANIENHIKNPYCFNIVKCEIQFSGKIKTQICLCRCCILHNLHIKTYKNPTSFHTRVQRAW